VTATWLQVNFSILVVFRSDFGEAQTEEQLLPLAATGTNTLTQPDYEKEKIHLDVEL